MTAMKNPRFISSLIALSALGVCGPVFAHGDEDHSAPSATTTSTPLPRIGVTTEDFELVAVLEPGRLLIHLDRADSNQPVPKAQLEVEGAGPSAGGWPGVAPRPTPIPPGARPPGGGAGPDCMPPPPTCRACPPGR